MTRSINRFGLLQQELLGVGTNCHTNRNVPVRVEVTTFWCILVLVVWAPLPLGSNRVWSLSVLAVSVALLLSIHSVTDLLGERRFLERLGQAKLVCFALGMFGLLVVFQMLPWPSTPITVDSHHTQQFLLATATYVGMFLLVLGIATSTRRLRWLAIAMVFSGVLQSLLAILLYSAKAKYSIFFFEIDHEKRTFGTFSYHNSLANYLIMCISLGIGLLLEKKGSREERIKGWRDRVRIMLLFVLSPSMLLRLMLVVMVIALVLTRSRMGNAALMVSLLVIGIPSFLLAARRKMVEILLLLSIVLVDVVIVGNWIGLDRVADRLSATTIVRQEGIREESLEDRSGPALHALNMIRERPLLGFGGGTFYTAYPRFNGEELRQYYDHAHNDFVQFSTEVGLIGTGLLGMVVISTIWRAVCVRRQPYSSLDSGLAFGTLLAIPAVLLQASVDFHFQIPANAMTFTVLLGLVWSLRVKKIKENAN